MSDQELDNNALRSLVRELEAKNAGLMRKVKEDGQESGYVMRSNRELRESLQAMAARLDKLDKKNSEIAAAAQCILHLTRMAPECPREDGCLPEMPSKPKAHCDEVGAVPASEGRYTKSSVREPVRGVEPLGPMDDSECDKKSNPVLDAVGRVQEQLIQTQREYARLGKDLNRIAQGLIEIPAQ